MKASLMTLNFAQIMFERLARLNDEMQGVRLPPHKRGRFKGNQRAARALQTHDRNVRLHPRG